jgi:hypothetical protein
MLYIGTCIIKLLRVYHYYRFVDVEVQIVAKDGVRAALDNLY